MGNIALIVCLEENTKPAGKGLMSYIKNKPGSLIRKIRIEKAENWFKQLLFDEHSLTYLINLPYDLSELKQFNKKRIERVRGKISEACLKKGIDCCILPASLTGIFETNDFFITAFGGRLLMRSILIDLINMVCAKKGVKLNELDVSVISGSNYCELIRVISKLSVLVKYLTVVADSKETIENGVNDILEETGLAVGITSDLKNALRNSQLVINLSRQNLKDYGNIKPKKVIINYPEDCVEGLRQDFTINGVAVCLPGRITEKIRYEVYAFYPVEEIAEILICQKINCLNSRNGGNLTGDDVYDSINYEFQKEGYKLTGYR